MVACAPWLGCTCGAQGGLGPPAEVPFWQDREGFRTELCVHGPSPQPGEPIVPTDDLEVIEYPSEGRILRGWMRWPSHVPAGTRAPLLVYYHGGAALGASDLDDCAELTRAGYAVFAPALRGENGNPGEHELFFGELDDALAALEHVRALPGIDPERIVLFGHSAGGVLSALAALRPGLRVLDTGSAGAMYDERLFDLIRFPFRDSPRERRLRVFAPHVTELRNPHFACAGEDDLVAPNLLELAERAEGAGAPFQTFLVPGNHMTSLRPCLTAFLARVQLRLRLRE